MIGLMYLKGLILIRQYDVNICHYWYFLDKGFRFETYVCNGCHDLMQKAANMLQLFLVRNMIIKFIFGI